MARTSKSTKKSKKTKKTRIPRVVPGYTRTEGLYGRFNDKGEELKYYDLPLAFNNVSDIGGFAGPLNAIVLGTGANERIGRKINIKSIEMIAVFHTGVTYTGGVHLRTMIFLDKQPNGIVPTIANLFQYTGAGEPATSPMNVAYDQRFQSLWERHYQCNPIAVARSTIAGAQTDTNRLSPSETTLKTKKRCNIVSTYDSVAGVWNMTMLRTNALYFFCAVNGSPANDGTIYGYIRIRYSDA